MSQAFPDKGRAADEIMAGITDQKSHDLVADGRAFAFVYDAGDDVRQLSRQAFSACMGINALDPTVYPSARRIENTVVKAMLELLNAPEGAVGTATAGGTESVLLAVKSSPLTASNRSTFNRSKATSSSSAHSSSKPNR